MSCHPVTRAQFEQNLHDKGTDAAFLSAIRPVLRPGLPYEAVAALGVVRKTIIELLPGDPWRGLAGEEPNKRRRRKKS